MSHTVKAPFPVELVPEGFDFIKRHCLEHATEKFGPMYSLMGICAAPCSVFPALLNLSSYTFTEPRTLLSCGAWPGRFYAS